MCQTLTSNIFPLCMQTNHIGSIDLIINNILIAIIVEASILDHDPIIIVEGTPISTRLGLNRAMTRVSGFEC